MDGTPPESAMNDGRADIGLFELLGIDDRPTLVFDLANSSKGTPIYHNASLGKIPLLGLKLGDGLLNRWRIVTGAEGDEYEYISAKRRQSEAPKLGRAHTVASPRPLHSPAQSQAKSVSDNSLEAQIAAFRLREGCPLPSSATGPLVTPESIQNSETLGRLDFFGAYPAMVPSSHHRFFMDLRRKVTFLMSDPRPAAMFWGKRRTMMYNEPYVHVTSQKHPGMMGKTFSEAWGEIEGDFIPASEKAYSTGASTVIDDARFYIERHGYIEETYYSIAMIPFLDDNDEIAFYNPVFDTTRQVIADRRMAFLLGSGQYISSSRDPQDFWQQLMFSLQADHPDLPFAVLYSLDGVISESASQASGSSQDRNWTLHGKIRIPDTCSDIPIAATEQSMELFLPTFSELVKSDSPTLLRADDGSLPEFIPRHMAAQNGHTDQPAIFLPIHSTADNLLGFLILGLNPRKRFDADYRVFIELLTRQLATSLASAVLFEEEIRRAARDRHYLTKKLAIQTHEALETESRFRRMADLAPVGMYHLEPNGMIVYCNDNYHE
ncbi:hypothetical protein BKA65DRAFT_528165 [Rhexocercosporidium sp. MPI-PUGE-AT-0058]|nr:hypothetical protein BKA65DRAFT_528165 [Rhexocercosporidium sp. MPI-PUGE-AT-0058]